VASIFQRPARVAAAAEVSGAVRRGVRVSPGLAGMRFCWAAAVARASSAAALRVGVTAGSRLFAEGADEPEGFGLAGCGEFSVADEVDEDGDGFGFFGGLEGERDAFGVGIEGDVAVFEGGEPDGCEFAEGEPGGEVEVGIDGVVEDAAGGFCGFGGAGLAEEGEGFEADDGAFVIGESGPGFFDGFDGHGFAFGIGEGVEAFVADEV
jgi:hypothetical protein